MKFYDTPIAERVFDSDGGFIAEIVALRELEQHEPEPNSWLHKRSRSHRR